MPWLLGALILGGSPAAVRAQAAPDSTAVERYQAMLVGLRDAVDRVSARANEFRRDLKTIGETTVLSRAARLDETCRATRTALADARSQLAAARLAPHQASARDSLVTAIGRLTASLQQDCERGLGPAGRQHHSPLTAATAVLVHARLWTEGGVFLSTIPHCVEKARNAFGGSRLALHTLCTSSV